MITSSLVLLRKKNRIQTFLLQENRLVLAKSYEEAASSLGEIYIGKVKNVVSSIQAAFVEYTPDTIGFLSLQSVKKPILTNRTYDGRILQGDELVVQVEKEGIKTKAPGLTTNLSFSGKYCVLTTGKTKLGYSSKLPEAVKQQVKAFLESEGLLGLLQSRQIGLVVRTNVGSLEDYAPLKEEILALSEQLQEVKEAAPHRTCFSKVYQPLPEYIAGIRDLYDNSYEKILTDDPGLYEELQAQAALLAAPVSFYQDNTLSLEKLYGIESKLQEALSEKVWLKSGGYLVIQPTEALTVIDVNSGKLLKSSKGQNSFFLTNKEAAEEIALQIRLRNLSGIIIVDFINQEDARLDKELMHYLQVLLKKDSVKTDVVDMTPLGLVEITRKKGKQISAGAVSCISLQTKGGKQMKLLHMEKVRDGKYLKNYELTYLNKSGREKKYEIVSRKELSGPEDLGRRPSGVSIVVYKENKMLLLKEFRMSINKSIYNLCAGMLEPGETIEQCIERELYEETGLKVKKILSILPPSFSAVGFSDTTTYIAFVEAEGELSDHTSENEKIAPQFFTRAEIRELMETEEFSSRSQMAAYFSQKKSKKTLTNGVLHANILEYAA